MKFIKWTVLAAILLLMGFAFRDLARGGYLSMPELADDEFPISFKSGLRAIVEVEILEEDFVLMPPIVRRLSQVYPERRFFGYAFEIESWLDEAWSYCRHPSAPEEAELRSLFPEEIQRNMTRAKMEWICFVPFEGEEIFRGVVFSTPKY